VLPKAAVPAACVACALTAREILVIRVCNISPKIILPLFAPKAINQGLACHLIFSGRLIECFYFFYETNKFSLTPPDYAGFVYVRFFLQTNIPPYRQVTAVISACAI
jgi:hypothetical protein